MSKKKIILIVIGGLIALGIIGSMMDDNENSTSSSNNPTSNANIIKEKQITIGVPDQIKFHENLKLFEGKYESVSNEMKKSKVYRELKSFLKKYLKNGYIKNWEGTLKSIGTNEGGTKAHITIESEFAGKDIEYKTWNNELSDMFTKSMLSLNSKVYKQLENLNEGDEVIFTARFIRDKKKGFAEQSITEDGTVTDPEYVMKFISIKKK